jgi:hypothetical protein
MPKQVEKDRLKSDNWKRKAERDIGKRQADRDMWNRTG